MGNINELFNSFIKDIINVFPEYEKRLTKYYKEVIETKEVDKNHPKIKEFLENIEEVSDKITNKDISLFNNGSFTGQISLDMIKNVNCTYCIIGHSEKRQFCREDDLFNLEFFNFNIFDSLYN